MKDNRRIITWSHIQSSEAYRNDIAKYHDKIYSIGLHEFGIRSNGKIYDFDSGQDYFDANGNHTGARFPLIIEQDMIDYPSIRWFFQFNCFGWSIVKPILDNNVTNAEGRLPQDQFIYELQKIVDLYATSRNSGTPLNLTGVEMDVEASMTSDYESQGNDVRYVQFLEKIKNEVCIPNNLKLRVNAHAMWGDNTPYYYRFHNYKLFAESADQNGNATIDEIQLMTYDFAWNGSSPGASTPIWWLHNVGEWCKQNFDPSVNSNAKLTIDNLYFGAAGYGHRWGMHDQEVVKRGSNVTYHQLLGWQNGHYRHYHYDDATGEYVYHDQEYLFQNGFQDPESKNEIMYPHVYDMFVPKYAQVLEQNGGNKTAIVGNYNRNDYAASYFKQQIPKWTNVRDIANTPSSVTGKAEAVVLKPEYEGMRRQDIPPEELRIADPNMNPDDPDFKHVQKTVDGEDHVFVGYFTRNRVWKPVIEYDTGGNVIGAHCELESEPNGRIEYTVNVPAAGNYHVIALTSFSWYTQAKLGGFINGQQYNVGGSDIPEWYPFFMKGSHWYDCGSFSLNAGANTITVQGELCDEQCPIFGFVVCDDFDMNFSGGELTFKTNVQPFKKKDGTNAVIPANFAIAAKMLRRDARPAILWDDEFRTYEEDQEITETTYYRQSNPEYRIAGGGDNLEFLGTENGQPVLECFSDVHPVGYSKGSWKQQNYKLNYNSAGFGQLILSKPWSVDLQIEGRITVIDGAQAGIRFCAELYQLPDSGINSVRLSEDQFMVPDADGYIFRLDFDRGVRELILEEGLPGTSRVVASQPIGNARRNVETTVKIILHNGVGHFYVGGVKAFIQDDSTPESTEATRVTHDGSVDVGNGNVTLQRTSGACGLYANNVHMTCTHLGISTTDRWEPLEKFDVTIDGQTQEFGRIARTGYSYDEYGYLIYSGLDEKTTRDAGQTDSGSVSLDYEMTVLDSPSWSGAKDIKITLKDAGVWFSQLLIGDRQGMSIIWAGDAYSIMEAMNIAVNDYGAKGIGLWAMGQEDPNVWEMIPDVPKQ